MARAYAGGRAGAAPSTTVGPNLYAIAARPLWLVEVGVFNTTTTAFVASLQRATTAGTSSGPLTEFAEDTEITTPVGVAATGFSAGPTITAGALVTASIGAAIGAGVIWTFGKNGIKIPAGTANGLVITTTTGTGQVCDFYFVWDE